MGTKIVITGVNGFIGRNLARILVDSGYVVEGISRKPIKLEKVSIHVGNLTDRKFLAGILKKTHALVHLAGITTHKELTTYAAESLRKSKAMTDMLLEVFSKDVNNNIFFYPSSGKVYGKITSLPIKENHPAKPTIPLGKIKLALEKEVKKYADFFPNKRFIVGRIFNVYGPGQRSSFLIPTIINQLITNKNKIILGDVVSRRDYLFVNDLCRAIITLIENESHNFSIYNIGSGQSVSPRELTGEFEKFLKTKIKIISKISLKRKGEFAEEKASITKLKSFGWRPKYSINAGLKICWNQRFEFLK